MARMAGGGGRRLGCVGGVLPSAEIGAKTYRPSDSASDRVLPAGATINGWNLLKKPVGADSEPK